MWDANGTSRTRPTLVWAWPEARSLHIASMATGSIPYSFRNLPLGSLTCLGPIPVHGTTLVLGPMRQTSIYISAWIYLSRIWTRDLSITLIDQRPYSHGHSTLIWYDLIWPAAPVPNCPVTRMHEFTCLKSGGSDKIIAASHLRITLGGLPSVLMQLQGN